MLQNKVDNNNTLKSQVYEQILTIIINNEFPIDELIVESRLTEMFNVSRAPVREALIELCREDILKNIPRAGYQIVRISEKEMRDAFQFRQIIELEGLRLAYERMTEKNIDELIRIAKESDHIRNTGQTTESLDQKMKLNDHFHIRLNGFSGNELLNRTLINTFRLIRRGLAQVMIRENELPLPVTTCHTGLANALKNRNFDEAYRNLEEDIQSYKTNIWKKML